MRIKTVLSSLGSSLVLSTSLSVTVVSAAPSQLYVSKTNCADTYPGSKQKPFCTIQKAVDTATNGTTVNVGPGTFAEQVSVANKNGITLAGSGDDTVIQFPASVTTGGAIVDVTNARDFHLSRTKVAGPFNVSSCASEEYGVRLNNNVSAKLDYVTVADIRPASDDFFGCQQGIGVQVGRQYAGSVATADLQHVNITGYAKVGLLVDNLGSSASVSQSTITGRGPTNLTALNGVQISRGATASLSQNTISGNAYTTPNGYTAAGVIVYFAGSVTAKQNMVNNNDVGFDIEGASNGTYLQNNLDKNTTNGFFVSDQYTTPGDTKNNTFTRNVITNTSGTTQYTPYDIEDDTSGNGTLGTANTWRQSTCAASKPSGLCSQ